MLNPFYKYIGEQLVQFFSQEAKKQTTDRYYLYLPSKSLIETLLKVFREHDACTLFTYQHIQGKTSYQTIALTFGKVKYVIATTLAPVSIDFLVTLRNEMSEQKGDWENTSLIFLCDTLNDSIKGGSRNLTDEGLPLHVKEIVGDLGDLVATSGLSKAEKAIMNHYLQHQQLESTIKNASFLDFEDTLSVIHQNQVTSEDLRNMHYFPDQVVAELVQEQAICPPQSSDWKKLQRQIDKRLNQNTKNHQDIERIHALGDAKEKLGERFGYGADILMRDDWYQTNARKLDDWEEKVKSKRQIAFESEKIQVNIPNRPHLSTLKWWKKPKSHTKAGRRTWSLLIFHPDYIKGETIDVILPFDKSASNKFLNKQSQKIAEASGKYVKVSFKLEDYGTTIQKVTYKHEDETKNKYVFHILVIKNEPQLLDHHRDNFTVITTSKKEQALQLTLEDGDLQFGTETTVYDLVNTEQVVDIKQGGIVQFHTNLFGDDGQIRFTLKQGEMELPIILKDEAVKMTPITGLKLWEYKKEKRQSFTIHPELTKVEIDHIPFSTHEKDRRYLRFEHLWLQKKMKKASIHLDELTAESCVLPAEVETAYQAFLMEMEKIGTIPSLVHYTEQLKEYAENYITAFINAIEAIQEFEIMSDMERALYTLGVAKEEDKIYMTPFSPLNVAYQLQIDREIAGEPIDSNILQQLKAVYTLPIYLDEKTGETYKPQASHPLPEWLLYLPSREVSVGETNNFLAKVVEEKLNQFSDHYEYLFALDTQTPMLVNVVYIPDDHEIVRGIVNWLLEYMKKNNRLTDLRHLDVHLYQDGSHHTSAFDRLNHFTNAKDASDYFQLNFAVNDFVPDDVLSEIQRVLHYAKCILEDDFAYSHITFYKMKQMDNVVQQKVADAPNSLNLNGLFTTTVATKTANGGYRSCFGLGEGKVEQSQLTHLAVKMNELTANLQHQGQNPYQKGIALATHVDMESENFLHRLYQHTHWLTFIDPVVDLKYFQTSSEQLIVVHYSDQHTSSNHYDAITVTDKSKQYYNVIQEFLQSQHVEVEEKQINGVIQAFNTFNGEWLLRAVQNRAHDKREKMSIVSAIKQALILFVADGILWVPISMEEIVRVTGNVKLKRKDGLFSGKTIGRHGNCSDDLLMIGLSQQDDNLNVHMYPVEVKVGHNQDEVIDKGIDQIHELRNRLMDQLVEEQTFDAKFLRNFFMRLFINNAQKMADNQFWPGKNYELDQKTVNHLLNDEFNIVNSLQTDLGDGMVISYKRETKTPTRTRRKGVIVVELPEQAGYQTLALPMNRVTNPFLVETASHSYQEITKPLSSPSEKFHETVKTATINQPDSPDDVGKGSIELSNYNQIADTSISYHTSVQHAISAHESNGSHVLGTTKLSEQIQPLIGFDHDIPVTWALNRLPNRHLVIGGRSGQGKTYFIQSLLSDLSKQNQSAVIIDYSSSYTKKQLEPSFVEMVGDKLQERVVYHEGFPLNPFLLRQKEVAGKIGIEKTGQAATRIVDVFASVYHTFGAQQKSALYQAVKKGIDMYGSDMRLSLLLDLLKDLEGFSNQVLMSISSRLMQLVDIDPFDYDAENQWDHYFSKDGKITIIQLDGYEQDEIKRLMVEFILWDMWYYTLNGTKERAIPVILDEAQNLNFADGSPAAKILREGRKFGWSAWFATQTFNNFSKDELSILDNAGMKVYFNPAESELKVIASRINGATEEELRMLKKGQCLVAGQFLQTNDHLGSPEYHLVHVPPMEER